MADNDKSYSDDQYYLELENEILDFDFVLDFDKVVSEEYCTKALRSYLVFLERGLKETNKIFRMLEMYPSLVKLLHPETVVNIVDTWLNAGEDRRTLNALEFVQQIYEQLRKNNSEIVDYDYEPWIARIQNFCEENENPEVSSDSL